MDTLEQEALPERRNSLRLEDLEYHRQLLAELQEAKQAFRVADVELMKAHGAIESWSRLLKNRYQLKDGDSVDEHGWFVRRD